MSKEMAQYMWVPLDPNKRHQEKILRFHTRDELAFISNKANELPQKIRLLNSRRIPIRLWCEYPFWRILTQERQQFFITYSMILLI